jgi:ABC-type amino acid transport substrate-binding protein
MTDALRRAGAAAAVVLLAACGAGAEPPAADAAAHATASAPSAEAADSWARVREAGGGTIRVLYVPADGFAYRDGGGSLTGVTVEIMREFAGWLEAQHDVSVEVDFVEEPEWRTFYNRVRDAGDGVFGIGNVTITEARRSELRFSPPYLTNVAVLITRDDVPEIRRMTDAAGVLQGLDALAFEGTLHETRLRAFRDAHLPAAEVALATSNGEILERVAGGGYFAYIDAYNFWRARDAGAPLQRHPAADDPAEEFGIIMPLGTDWGPLVDGFFQAGGGYRNTAAYRTLLVRHLGEPLTAALEAARAAAGSGT